MQIEIFQDTNQLYFFRIKTNDGKILLTSNGHQDEISLKRKIESAIVISTTTDHFARHTTPNGKHYFTLQDKDGTVLGTSPNYDSEQEREKNLNLLLEENLKA